MAKLNLSALNSQQNSINSNKNENDENEFIDSVTDDGISDNFLSNSNTTKIDENQEIEDLEKKSVKIIEKKAKKPCLRPKVTLKDLNLKSNPNFVSEDNSQNNNSVEENKPKRARVSINQNGEIIKSESQNSEIIENNIENIFPKIESIEEKKETLIVENEIIDKSIEIENNKDENKNNFSFVDGDTNTTLIVEEKNELFSNYIASFDNSPAKIEDEIKKEIIIEPLTEEVINISNKENNKQKTTNFSIFNNFKNILNEKSKENLEENLEKKLKQDAIRQEKLQLKAQELLKKLEEKAQKEKIALELKSQKEKLKQEKLSLKLEEKRQKEIIKNEKLELKAQYLAKKQEEKVQKDFEKNETDEKFNLFKQKVLSKVKSINRKNLYLGASSIVMIFALGISINVFLLKNDSQMIKADLVNKNIQDSIIPQNDRLNDIPNIPKEEKNTKIKNHNPDIIVPPIDNNPINTTLPPDELKEINQNSNSGVVNENINKDFDNNNKSDKIKNELKQFLLKKYNHQ